MIKLSFNGQSRLKTQDLFLFRPVDLAAESCAPDALFIRDTRKIQDDYTKT